jgi:Flp pilus assembly protein TadD
VSEFVVCRQCGTRIKAGRQHCLRCFAPLPEADEPVRPPIWESLGLGEGKVMMIGIGASLVVIALVAVIWRTWPERIDDTARPSPTPASRAVTPGPAVDTPERTADSSSSDPLTIPDATPDEVTPAQRADLEATRTAYEQALAKAPDDAKALDSLGLVLLRLGRPDEAAERFQRAIALDAARAAYHLDLGHAFTDLGNRSRAVQEYREAARLIPEDAATHNTLGLALQKNDDYQAALAEFERAIALAPEDPKPHLGYAVSLDHLQRPSDALREYRRYLDMRPSAPYAQDVRARIQALASSRP